MSLVTATSVALAMSTEPGSRSHWSCSPSIVAPTTRAVAPVSTSAPTSPRLVGLAVLAGHAVAHTARRSSPDRVYAVDASFNPAPPGLLERTVEDIAVMLVQPQR